MNLGGQFDRLLCRCGIHSYSPDVKAGYPYQTCERCEKMGIYRPTFVSALTPAQF